MVTSKQGAIADALVAGTPSLRSPLILRVQTYTSLLASGHRVPSWVTPDRRHHTPVVPSSLTAPSTCSHASVLRPELCAWDWFRERPPGKLLSGESRRVGCPARCAHPGGGTHRHGLPTSSATGLTSGGVLLLMPKLLWHRTAALRFSGLLHVY